MNFIRAVRGGNDQAVVRAGWECECGDGADTGVHGKVARVRVGAATDQIHAPAGDRRKRVEVASGRVSATWDRVQARAIVDVRCVVVVARGRVCTARRRVNAC